VKSTCRVCLLLFIRFDFLALRSCVTSPTNQMMMMMFFCRLLVNHLFRRFFLLCVFSLGGAHHRMIPEMRNDVKVTLEAEKKQKKGKNKNRAKCVNMWSGVEFLVTGCRRYVPLLFIYFIISLTIFPRGLSDVIKNPFLFSTFCYWIFCLFFYSEF
jgi:hypothetical protein